jgi:hypothetical protein
MFLHVYVLGMTTKSKYDTVNSVYSVPNSKYDHLSCPPLLGYINYYYEYKLHTTASVNANGHETLTSDWYKLKSSICNICLMNKQ